MNKKPPFLCLLGILFISLITMDYSGFTALTLKKAGDGGIISLVLAFVVLTVLYLVLTDCVFKDKEMIEKAPAFLLYIYTLLLVFSTVFTIKIISEKIAVYLLPDSPVWVIELIAILFLWWASTKSFEAFAYFASVFSPLIFIILLIVIVPPMLSADFSLLLPIDISNPGNIFLTAISGSGIIFMGLLLIPLFFKKIEIPSKSKMRKSGLILISIVALIFLLNFWISTGILGKPLSKELIWPNMDLLQASNQHNFIFESYELFLVFASVKMYFITALAFLKGCDSIGIILEKRKIDAKQFKQKFKIAIFVILLLSSITSAFPATQGDGLNIVNIVLSIAPIVFTAVCFAAVKKGEKNEA